MRTLGGVVVTFWSLALLSPLIVLVRKCVVNDKCLRRKRANKIAADIDGAGLTSKSRNSCKTRR